jgi:PncC family amidohydrolase
MTESGLESKIGEGLRRRKLTLATAESCTAGLIAHRITNVPGSSDYFLGGIVAYANKTKMRLLDVSQEVLDRDGAVSEETAREMAQGARRALEADVGLSVTGIAGPGGGTEEKPVGLTFVGISGPIGTRVERHVWDGDRAANKAQSATAALRLLWDYLEKLE